MVTTFKNMEHFRKMTPKYARKFRYLAKYYDDKKKRNPLSGRGVTWSSYIEETQIPIIWQFQ